MTSKCKFNAIKEKNDKINKFFNEKDYVDGYTPYHMACKTGHTQTIQYLINQIKVDLLIESKSGQIGSKIASAHGKLRLSKQLELKEKQTLQSSHTWIKIPFFH